MAGKAVFITLALYFLHSVSSQKIPDFDEVLLAEQWKRSSCCSVNNLDSPAPDCKSCAFTDSAADWTIHGLWPSDSTRNNRVEQCTPAGKIDFDSFDKNLKNSLASYWPNNKHGASGEIFWFNEWKKHGTCAIGLPQISDAEGYFRKTVDLYRAHQVGDMLNKEGIVPQKKYKLDEIFAALRKNLQNCKPFIKCIEKGGIAYFAEVYVCFDKQFNLKACSGSKESFNCATYVYYP